MTGPTPTHSDQNPVSGMAVTPNPAEERTEALGPIFDLVGDWLIATVSALIGIGSWDDAQTAYDRAIGPMTHFAGMALAATSGAADEAEFYGGAE